MPEFEGMQESKKSHVTVSLKTDLFLAKDKLRLSAVKLRPILQETHVGHDDPIPFPGTKCNDDIQ
jgi:hypothetical protein